NIPVNYEKATAGRQFSIVCHVYVDFFSDNDVRRHNPFPGFSVKATRKSSDVKNHPESLVSDILDKDLVPFPLDSFVWIEDSFHCGGGGAALSGEDELARKLLDFVLLVDGKPENADRDSVAATLDIDRAVFVPEEEFRWWVSWFDEQRRVCPNFNLEYRRAIGKPRGRTEAVRKTAGRSLAGEIESVAVEAECSICLEEFSEGARVVQLPCRHMFDEDCILRWLSENRVCPYCRHLFPLDWN
ncbi:PREDICTED: uncharacterized protein LOC105965407, partial [Erythranthe guttata]|uniref:uncharacterized protein LOC105965407 n=1 Tax=Erythranthe guttata TaxID=4155 RepID=UPI00064DD43F